MWIQDISSGICFLYPIDVEGNEGGGMKRPVSEYNLSSGVTRYWAHCPTDRPRPGTCFFYLAFFLSCGIIQSYR